MVNHSVADEIIALDFQRVQKIFGLFDHVLVLELFSPTTRRLYFVFDINPRTKTLHVQRDRPRGNKKSSPFILLLNKYLSSQPIRFFKMDVEGATIKAVSASNDEPISLIFETEPHARAGLFCGDELIGSIKPQDAPTYHAGYLVVPHQTTKLEKNLALAKMHQKALLEFNVQAHLASILADLKHQISKKKTLIKNVEADRAKCEEAILLERDAQLLKANMHALKRGMKEALVIDYETEPATKKTIALDPRLSPQEFVTKTFTKIKKARRGLAIISDRISLIQQELDDLMKKQAAMLEGGELSSLSLLFEPQENKSRGARTIVARKPYRQFISSDNIHILVGKSARDSDVLTKSARGNEWFFHARDASGAHVIVKTSDNLPPRTLVEAALLAQYFSKQRDRSASIVQYTRVKHVSKKKGLPPGAVLISQESTIEIEANQNMLDALFTRVG